MLACPLPLAFIPLYKAPRVVNYRLSACSNNLLKTWKRNYVEFSIKTQIKEYSHLHDKRIEKNVSCHAAHVKVLLSWITLITADEERFFRTPELDLVYEGYEWDMYSYVIRVCSNSVTLTQNESIRSFFAKVHSTGGTFIRYENAYISFIYKLSSRT